MEALVSLFIVPTLAGYLFATKSSFYQIKTGYFTTTRLVVESLLIGIFFLYLSYTIFGVYRFFAYYVPDNANDIKTVYETLVSLMFLNAENWCKSLWLWTFHPLIAEIELRNNGLDEAGQVMYLISNQSISTLGIALFLVLYEITFRLVAHGKYEISIGQAREKEGGPLEKLLNYASDTQSSIQITMGCGKVYVALVKELPPINPSLDHHNFLRIIPLFSGYRDVQTKEVHFTTDYAIPLRKFLQKDAPETEFSQLSEALFYGIVIDLNDVVVASIWTRKAYEAFSEISSENNVTQ